MNIPPAHLTQQLDDTNDLVDFIESDSESSGTWASTSEASSEDGDEDDVESLADERCADEAFWEENRAADSWLARFQGGTSLLYPQLFVIAPSRDQVQTPIRYPNRTSLLQLPSEIRNRIYRHYFEGHEGYEELRHSGEGYAPFRDREGIAMQRICLGSSHIELSFWLSTAILQTSRQLRFEAMPILFGSRVITVEWLHVLPRVVEFLGREGCTLVRYLDIWDTLNLQEDNKDIYQDAIGSAIHFTGLQHLRIVVSKGVCRSGLWSDRLYSWFDQNDWKRNRSLKQQAIPKIRRDDLERWWPEYELLKNLTAQKFTLAVDSPLDDEYLEFDRGYGAYPHLSEAMRTLSASKQYTPSSANDTSTFILPKLIETFDAIELLSSNSGSILNHDSGDEDFDSSAWQETDTLANKAIPFYNFLREFFHINPPTRRLHRNSALANFITFPTARKSKGRIMQDCVFCYLRKRHCGYHAMPDQPPFRSPLLDVDNEVEDLETLQARFEGLSYVDMQEVGERVVYWLRDTNNIAKMGLLLDAKLNDFLSITALFDYLGWPELSNDERLSQLDNAVEAGWIGKRIDKGEVPPWDVLYREIHSSISYRP